MSDELGIVLIGGERTPAGRLCAELDLEHLTVGDLPRQRATASGRGYVTADGILPEALVIGMARLAERPRFLCDGFPQTLTQAHALTYVLRLAGRQLRAALCIAARVQCGQVPARQRLRFGVDEFQRRLADQCRRAGAEQPLRLGIDVGEAAAGVDQHGIGQQLQQAALAQLAVAQFTLGLAAVGDVAHDDGVEVVAAQAGVRDGGLGLQTFLRQSPRYAEVVVTPADFRSTGRKATTATAAQWACLQEMQDAVPAASIALHVRELSWLADPKAPRLVQHTLVVTQNFGPLVLRREYCAPET